MMISKCLRLAEIHWKMLLMKYLMIYCTRLLLTVSGVSRGKIALGQLPEHVESGLLGSSVGDALGNIFLSKGDITSVHFWMN